MDVMMPQLGETVAEATLTRWLKREGDRVAEGDPLFEISTDKVDMEIPSAATGILGAFAVQENQLVPVGTVLAVIETADQVPGPAAHGPAAHGPAAHGPAASGPAASGPAASGPAASGSAEPSDRARLTPVVRKLLKEHGVDAAEVTGTGPHGRVTRQDVFDAAARKAPTAAASTPQSPSAPPAPAPPAPVPLTPVPPTSVPPTSVPLPSGAASYAVPFTTIRRVTAEHMVRSKAVSPHTLMVIEVDYSAVDKARTSIATQWREAEGHGLTYLPFTCRAVVDTIAKFPHVNASVAENGLIVHRQVHLGIAVDLDGDGLVVPVLRDAEGKRLKVLAREIAALARAARTRTAGPDLFRGGTFTISNPGPFGTLLTGAIINQPQVAILATDAVTFRPVAVPLDDGQHAVAVRPVGYLALTFDHRAIDGGYAARFLAAVKEIIQTRDWTAELLRRAMPDTHHPGGPPGLPDLPDLVFASSVAPSDNSTSIVTGLPEGPQVQTGRAGIEVRGDIVFATRETPGGPPRELSMNVLVPRTQTQTQAPNPLVVCVPGGGFVFCAADSGLDRKTYLAEAGYVVATIQYRTILDGATYVDGVADVKSAIRFLRANARDYGIDTTKVAVWGESAGGYLAAMVGTTSGAAEFETPDHADQSSAVQAVVDQFGASDLLTMAADFDEAARQAQNDPGNPAASYLLGPGTGKSLAEDPAAVTMADPATHARPGAPPFLLMHGSADNVVSPSQTLLLHTALLAQDVDSTRYVIEGAGHGDLAFLTGDPEGALAWSAQAVMDYIVGFLDSRLKAA
jgi:2-oxoglutarate dehydrogenase E2 component (dihydrolipoamide succinyltransferase)